MKRNILIAGTIIAITTSLHGGGKNILPAVAPVVPLELTDPSPWYIGAGFVMGRFYSDQCPKTFTCAYEDLTYGLMVRGGYEWNQYIGIEARGIRTFWGADDLGGEKLQHIGFFAKPTYPIGEDFDLYGLLGYGWTKTITDSQYLPHINESGFSWGVGLEFDLSSKDDDYEEDVRYERPFDGHANQEKGWGLFIDYQQLLIKSDLPDMDIVSIGVTYDF